MYICTWIFRYFDRKFHHYSLYSGGTSRRNVSFFPSFSFLFFFFFFIHYFLEIDFPFFDKIERVVLIPIVSSLIQSRIQPFESSIHPSILSLIRKMVERIGELELERSNSRFCINHDRSFPSSYETNTPWNGNLPPPPPHRIRIYRSSRMHVYTFIRFFLLFDKSYRFND